MKDKLQALGGIAFFAVILLAAGAALAFFILGSAWAAKNLLGPLIVAGWAVFALLILVLLPLSIFRRLRDFTGAGIFLSSYLFGLIAWLLSFILTYELWGTWAVVAGILLLGGAVVPFALLATLFNGMWGPFFMVLALFILVFATRVGGGLIAESRHS
ncbi:MAG: hypothetical protein Q7K57_17505 [Burkholderiaceae bacterium]|nr:hypothetical protein [Burkholderiaceae bacterium]